MSGLEGLKVLDLSWGIAGPMTGMLLADHGADVTRIEHPAGDPFAELPGSRVWNRRKHRVALDLADPAGRGRLLELVDDADVFLASFAPDILERLGLDYAALHDRNPRLIYCSITGYGRHRPDAGRPGYDGLVAARTGHCWEVRGRPGGTVAALSGATVTSLGEDPACWVGPDRGGPLFSGVPWVSLGTFYATAVGLFAALRARGLTGRGQRVDTSLLGGVLASTGFAWMRAQRPASPNFGTWAVDSRAPKGFFRAADGKWTHHWVPLPEFVLGAAERSMRTEDVPGPRQATMRIGMDPDEVVLVHHFTPVMAEAVAQFPSADWVRAGAEVGTPVQTVRSPEEALLDPDLLADGCVAEHDDPDHGPIRHVGRVIDLISPLSQKSGGPPRLDQAAGSRAPLDGITVLDLGLAVAGPYGAQVLAQLGADVIKITTAMDAYWLGNHIAMSANRDKRAIGLDLKTPGGREVFAKLVERADVVHHNMRYDAAERLGIDYETLRQRNPGLIYCHVLGYEQGPRERVPGNDQTAGALAGTEWLDGGLDSGGRPVWSITSLGDVGAGFLSAIGTLQALYERDRTGEGKFVRTSVLYAHLLNASNTWVSSDGRHAASRPQVDAELRRWNALYGLYMAQDGEWLCVSAVLEKHWRALCPAIGRPDLVTDEHFATSQGREDHDAGLAEILEAVFLTKPAERWFATLDAVGVPCEMVDPDYVFKLFGNDASVQDGVLADFEHPVLGTVRVPGRLWELSDSPPPTWRPPPVAGQHTREIMEELGYTPAEIDSLIVAGGIAEGDVVSGR